MLRMRRPRIVCKDGVSLSVQASEYHYSLPRKNLFNLLEYRSVEVGFPRDKDGNPLEMPEEWKEFQDGLDSDVFGYVPMELVMRFVAIHDGSLIEA